MNWILGNGQGIARWCSAWIKCLELKQVEAFSEVLLKSRILDRAVVDAIVVDGLRKVVQWKVQQQEGVLPTAGRLELA